MAAPETDADRQPPAGEVIERRERLREVDGTPERGEEHGRGEPEPLGARGSPGEQRDGFEAPDAAEDLLDDPGAFEAERLGAREEGAELGDLEAPLEHRLRDRDAERDPALHGANPTTRTR